MKSPITFILVAILTGCSTAPKENYQQAYAQYLADGNVTMKTLRALDTGDIQKARRVAMTSLHVTLNALSDFAAQAQPTPEQKQETAKLAREVLDYMLVHREDYDPRLPSIRIGVRGLQKILTQPEYASRLRELSDYLAGVEKKMVEVKP